MRCEKHKSGTNLAQEKSSSSRCTAFQQVVVAVCSNSNAFRLDKCPLTGVLFFTDVHCVYFDPISNDHEFKIEIPKNDNFFLATSVFFLGGRVVSKRNEMITYRTALIKELKYS